MQYNIYGDNMKTKYIIFDKDGTLLDFEKFWVKILVVATQSILKHFDITAEISDEIYSALGVENGIVNIDGVYCHGDFEGMGNAYYDVITSNGYTVDKAELFAVATEEFRNNFHVGEAVANCKDLRSLLLKLRDMGIKTAIVTADDAYSTKACLELLGVSDCFNEIFVSDDGYPNKPDPYYINMLCDKEGISPQEIIMVGDTLNDMKFAENGGVGAIAIAKNEKNRLALAPYAIATISSLDSIFEFIE